MKLNKLLITLLLIASISCINKKREESTQKSSSEEKGLKEQVSDRNNTNPERNGERSQQVDKADNKEKRNKKKLPVRKHIVGRVINVKPVIYSTRSSTLIYDDYLVQIETWADTLFQVFKLPACKSIGGFGQKGRGPKEFPFPDEDSAIDYENGIMMYDVQKGFLFIDLTQFESGNQFSVDKQVKVPQELIPLNDPLLLNDSIIIGKNFIFSRPNGYKEQYNYKHLKLNIQSEKLNFFGPYPDLYPEDRKKLFPSIYSSNSIVKPDKTKFATFFIQVKMFRIYSSDGTIEKEVFLKKQKDFFDGQWIRKNAINYYTCVRATNEYLYVLCQNEHSHSLSKSNPTLELWDWNGNPIAFLKLDQSICSFDVTDDNSKVYATSFNDMDKIYQYGIGNLIPGNQTKSLY